MKLFPYSVIILSVLSIPLSAHAQSSNENKEKTHDSEEYTDSTKINILNEVVVEGANQYVTSNKSVYYPSSKEIDSSYDVTSLLQRMSIPELSVSPFDGIKTVSGNDVQIFINYLKANDMDMQAVNIKDVISIEYLDFPNDPRFHGAEHVVNVIVKEYEYGGYTKIWNRTDWKDKVKLSTSAFQRINYKRMTYDLYFNHSYSDLTHIGTSSTETYNIPKENGGFNTFTRTQKFIDSKSINTTIPLTLRIGYQSDKITVRNSIGYNFNNDPINRSHGQLNISTLPDETSDNFSFSKSKSNSLSWIGEFYFSLSKGWFLSHKDAFRYSYNNNKYEYESGYQNTHFVNNSNERAYSYRGEIDLEKTFANIHSLNFTAAGGMDYNHVNYTGSTDATEHLGAPNLSGCASYSLNTQSLYLGIRGGLSWEGRRINRIKHYNSSPFFNFNFSYAYSSKNKTSFFLQYVKSYCSSTAMAPVTIRSNEFMYLRGNPDLKSYPILMGNLSHTFLPNNLFNVSGYINYTGFYNRITEAYFPMQDDQDAIVKTYTQKGDFQCVSIGANLRFKYKNKLSIRVEPSFSMYHKTGLYRNNYYPFSITTYGTYSINNWYMGYFLCSPKRIVFTDEERYTKGVLQHEFHFGFSKSGFHTSLSFCNPFRKSRIFRKSILETPYYSSFSNLYSPYHSRCLVFTVTYTLGYGKKIQNFNEADKMNGASSVVLGNH